MPRLDRFATTPPRQKYALLKMRRLWDFAEESNSDVSGSPLGKEIRDAVQTLRDAGLLDFGETPETDFFAIRIKDKGAASALSAYAEQALARGDLDLAKDVWQLAQLARDYPNPQAPT